MRRLKALVLVVFVLTSCGDKPKVLDKTKMQTVLWDIIQLDAYSQHLLAVDTAKKDSAKISLLQEKVFSLHGITRQQYLDSYNYYNERPEDMRIILDSITTNAQEKRNFIMQKRYGKEAVK